MGMVVYLYVLRDCGLGLFLLPLVSSPVKVKYAIAKKETLIAKNEIIHEKKRLRKQGGGGWAYINSVIAGVGLEPALLHHPIAASAQGQARAAKDLTAEGHRGREASALGRSYADWQADEPQARESDQKKIKATHHPITNGPLSF